MSHGEGVLAGSTLESRLGGVSSSEAFLLLSPHCDRQSNRIPGDHTAQSRTHILLPITSSRTVSTAQHPARVGQHVFIAPFGCVLNLLTSAKLLQTFSQHVGATSNVSLVIPRQACRAQRCFERQCSYPLGYLSSSHPLVCQLVHAQ